MITPTPTPPEDTGAGQTAASTTGHSKSPWWLGELLATLTHPDTHRANRMGRNAPTTSRDRHPAANAAGTLRRLRLARSRRVRDLVLADHHSETTRQARQAVIDLVHAGYHLGAVPYGYRSVRVPGTTADGRIRSRRRLVPDETTGPVVTLIFHWRVHERLGSAAIARRLATDPDWCPPPRDPHTGLPRPWTASIVRHVLTRIVYTGRQVWARTTGGRVAPPEQWITSGPMVHEPLVDDDTFTRAQQQRTSVPTPPDSEPGTVCGVEGPGAGRNA